LCIGLWGALSAAAVGAICGCRSGTRPPPKTVTPYAGPVVEVDSSGAQHMAVLRAPSAGWAFTLDRTEPSPNGVEVFVTATRPNPAFMHAQVECLLRAGAGVGSSRPIGVFVRIVNFGSDPGGVAYHASARAGG
jgi:hypothetical protein